MQKNIGKKDRLIRLLLACVCFGAILFFDNIFIKIILIGAGLFNIFQATFSWCAWYALLGKNTCPVKK